MKIYKTEKELYKKYNKHPLYNYPIWCNDCKRYVSFDTTNKCLKCNCQLFNVVFAIGIKQFPKGEN